VINILDAKVLVLLESKLIGYQYQEVEVTEICLDIIMSKSIGYLYLEDARRL